MDLGPPPAAAARVRTLELMVPAGTKHEMQYAVGIQPWGRPMDADAAVAGAGERPGHGDEGRGEGLGLAFDQATIGMALVGLDGRFRRVNPALCGLLGLPEAELVGRPVAELVSGEVLAEVCAGLRGAGGEPTAAFEVE